MENSIVSLMLFFDVGYKTCNIGYDCIPRVCDGWVLGYMASDPKTRLTDVRHRLTHGPNPGLCKSGLVREYRGSAIGVAFALVEVILVRKPAVGAPAY